MRAALTRRMRQQVQRFMRSLVVLGLVVTTVGADAEPEQTPAVTDLEVQQAPVPRSRFQRMVAYLQTAEPRERSEFAIVALSRVADAYATEARLARRQSGSQLGAWSATVNRYASQMSLLIDDIELGLPVQLRVSEEQSLAITVGDRTVIVSNPRLAQQGALEQSILTEFCSAHSCVPIALPESTVGTRADTGSPIPVSTVQVHPNWQFTESGSNCAHGNLTLHFDRTLNMASARQLCQQFLQEVVMLGDELAWQLRHLVVVEWEKLEIQASPGRPEHIVLLNTVGDAILVSIPLLYDHSGLLRQLRPWLQAHAEGRPEPVILLDASEYGWQQS